MVEQLFDGYHKWLGIAPEEQPPHHYRLLGLKIFESDRDVIESAADGRMMLLKSHQAGKHGAVSQKLLNEVANARVVLLNAEKRAAYDQLLRNAIATRQAAAKEAAAKAAAAKAAQAAQAKKAEPEAADIHAAPFPQIDTTSSRIGSASAKGNAAKPVPGKGTASVGSGSGVTPSPSSAAAKPGSAAKLPNKKNKNLMVTGAIAGSVLFLLVCIGIAVAISSGGAKKQNVAKKDGAAVDEAPVFLDSGSSSSGVANSNSSLPASGGSKTDRNNEKKSLTDGPSVDDFLSQLPSKPAPKKESSNSSSTSSSEKGGAEKQKDNQKTLDPMPSKEPASKNGSVTSDVPVKPRGVISASDAPPIVPARGAVISLLELVDIRKHVLSGTWWFDGMALTARSGNESSAVQIPFAPPAEYDLLLTVDRQGFGPLGIGLVAEGKHFHFLFDVVRDDGPVSGVAKVGDAEAWENPTTISSPVFETDKEVTVRIQVRRDRLRVVRDDEILSDWAAKYSDAAAAAFWPATDPTRLAIGVQQARHRILRCDLLPVSVEDRRLFASLFGGDAGADVGSRQPPTDAAQETVRKSLAETYGLNEKKTASQKTQLAGEFMAMAKNARQNPVEQFVLLRESQRLANEAADPQLEMQVLESMAVDFDIDVYGEQGKILLAMVATARDDAGYTAILRLLNQYVDRAMNARQYGAGLATVEAMYKALQKKPTGLKHSKSVNELKAKFAEPIARQEAIEAAQQKIKSSPQDPQANEMLGRWLCFTQEDFGLGLSFLAKGPDGVFKTAATRELNANSKNADEQIKVGDAWWEVSDSLPAEEKMIAKRRAAFWYRKGLPQITSVVDKARLEKRLNELGPATSTAGTEKKSEVMTGTTLMILSDSKESDAAKKAWEKFSVPFEMSSGFDMKRTDYSAYSTIVGGSEDMKYWNEGAAKAPEAFQHLEKFVNQGGHLIIFGAFSGQGMHHMESFGITTSGVHNEYMAPAGSISEKFLEPVPDKIGSDKKLRSTSSFTCSMQHVVILKRGRDPGKGEPVMITRRHQKGQITFISATPGWSSDTWIFTALASWISNGCPMQ